jgi:hypothetical protein
MVTDVLVSHPSYNRTLNEAVTVVDAMVSSTHPSHAEAEAVATADSSTFRANALNRTLAETVTSDSGQTVDSVARVLSTFPSANETLSMGDVAVRHASVAPVTSDTVLVRPFSVLPPDPRRCARPRR